MRTSVASLARVAALGVISLGAVGADAAEAAKRTYVTGKYELVVDGQAAGFVSSVAGGAVSGDVVVEKAGPDHVAKKHISGVKYEDIGLSVGTGMSRAFYGWIKDALDHKALRKAGTVQVIGSDGKELSKLTFSNALVTEVGFPACDAASKDAAFLSVALTPEVTRRNAGSNAVVPTHEAQAGQKHWLASNFRLDFPGMDTSRVSKIDAFVVRQKVADSAVGELKTPDKEPVSLDVPNLVFTTPESAANDWYAWEDSFVVKGNNSDAQEKTGTLTYLAPDLRSALFKVTFKHAGIVKVTPDKVEAGSENVRRVKVELYVEDVSFDFDPSSAF